MKIPLYLRLALTADATLAFVSTDAVLFAAMGAFGALPTLLATVESGAFAAAAVAVMRGRSRMRDYRDAMDGFVWAVKSLAPDRIYVDRGTQVVLVRPPVRRALLYRAPEDDITQWADDMEAGRVAITTADVFEALPPGGWVVTAVTLGGTSRRIGPFAVQVVGADPSWWARRRARWLGLRTGTSIATAAELREVRAQVARAEPLDPAGA